MNRLTDDLFDAIMTGRPGPTDDGIDHQPDGHSQAELDRLADEAADRYETEMDRRWE